jgi:hypothetical protein
MEGLAQFNPSSSIHQGIKQFINEQAALFAKKGKDVTTRNGLAFATPAEYSKNPEGKWTFSKNQIIAMMKKDAQRQATKRIETEKKRFEAYMKKHGGTSLEQNSDTTEDNSSPSVKTSPSGTPTKGGKPQKRGLFDVLQ